MTNIDPSSYHPGLEGVIAGTTKICQVDEEAGGLFYRGYSIEDLARQASFEEVLYLLLLGNLPNQKELKCWEENLVEARNLPGKVWEAIRLFPSDAHPLDRLRTAVSLLALYDPDTGDNRHEANLRKAIRLASQVPLLIGGMHRLSLGLEPLSPKRDLSLAGNLIYLVRGTPPAPEEIKGMNVSLILYAEHEFNASTFAARVTTATLSDFHSGIVTAIGTLKGPLHGGANEEVMKMLLEIGSEEKCEEWITRALAEKKKIPGFGHRVYKKGDSRSPLIQEVSLRIAEWKGNMKWHRMSLKIEAMMKEKKNLYPNLDFYSASAYYEMELPISLYTSLFVTSRLSGWGAHIMEQQDHNRLIRPRSLYQGPSKRAYEPIERRSS
ncbi:MAG: citrate synthase [Nitrospirae bacterium]|nr:citrate synthase [Nitrospirota bacterium]